jgi:hypothetical protein
MPAPVLASAAVLAIAMACNPINAGYQLGSPETKTSVCEIETEGTRLNGQVVRLQAVSSSDRLDSASPSDPDCPKVLPSAWLRKPQDERTAAFFSAVYAPPADYDKNPLRWLRPDSRRFSVDVTGEVSWSTQATPHGTIAITKVWSFRRFREAGRLKK